MTPSRFLILLLLFFLPFLSSAQISSVTITIDGLTCSMCSYGVEKSLLKLGFVDEVEMDLNANTAVVTFQSEESISLYSLSDQVRNAGFSVRSIAVKAQVGDIAEENKSEIMLGTSLCRFVGIEKSELSGDVDLKLVGKEFMGKKDWKKWQAEHPETQAAQLNLNTDNSKEFCLITL